MKLMLSVHFLQNFLNLEKVKQFLVEKKDKLLSLDDELQPILQFLEALEQYLLFVAYSLQELQEFSFLKQNLLVCNLKLFLDLKRQELHSEKSF